MDDLVERLPDRVGDARMAVSDRRAIWPDVKSSTRLPSVVSTQAPSARATTNGAKPAA